MAGIRSINEPRAPLSPEVNVPKIATQAIEEPPRKFTTVFTADRIVGMTLYNETIVVATENGVYIRDTRDGIFKRLKFEIVEEENQ